MPGITDPSEEYFKDGLWGWVVNQWKKLIADAAGHLQVDVVASGLPLGGATAANQTTMITALQLIDDLRNALNSIATDELDIVFDGQNVDVEVTQTTPADLCTAIHGWDGSVWRKLPLVFGYSDRWYDGGLTTKVGDGSFDLYTTAVPAGYIYVLQVATMHNDSALRGDAYIALKGNAHHHKVAFSTTPARFAPTLVTGPIVLKQGDQVRFYQWNCINGDLIYSAAWGYKMRIAE